MPNMGDLWDVSDDCAMPGSSMTETNAMIIYGSTLSPFVRKVAMFAGEKGVAFDLRPTGIGDPDPGFRAASPFGKMPAIDDDGFTLADSSAICHYLEAKHPGHALIPDDPQARGRTIWFDEFADTLLFACGAKIFFNRIVAPRFLGREGDLAVADTAERDELPPLLAWLETQIPPSGYLVADRLTLADIAVSSPFANFRYLGLDVDRARYPRLAAYVAAMLGRPSVAALIERDLGLLKKTEPA